MQRAFLQGIGYIVIVHVCGAILAATIRYLSDDFHSYQLVFYYMTLPLLVVVPLAMIKKWECRTRHLPLFTMRAICEFLGFSLSFYGLGLLSSLPMHTALTFTVPLFATILAVLFLREHINIHIIIALILGMLGVWIITQPDSSINYTGVACVLASAFMFSVCSICIKKATHCASAYTTLFYMYLLTGAITTPFAVSEWQPIMLPHLPWIALIMLLSLMQQFFVIKALSLAPVTVIVPMQFSQLVFISFLSYIIFEELISSWTLVGALLIFTGTLYHLFHSVKKSRA